MTEFANGGALSVEAFIVQFPHPGGEHVPGSQFMPWNRGRHGRKFMVRPGALVSPDGEAQRQTDLVFWGEWEPPSRVVQRWPRAPGLPTVLHEPCWEQPDFVGRRQNTDPWVFGEAFLFSNCKQLTPAYRPSALQRLHVGTLILFGSVVKGEFAVDTVFVVGEVVGPYLAADADLPVDEAFSVCTLDSLQTLRPERANASFTLYRGATPANRVSGMFGFVPCLPRNAAGPRFSRPPIDLPGIVNPRSRQAVSGAKISRSLREVETGWSSVVNQVLNAGLELGCALSVPARC